MPIHIDDLPPLLDLTEEQLKELFGAGRPNVRLSIEALEDRQSMATGLFSSAYSTSSVWPKSASSPAAIYQPVNTTVQVKAPTAAVGTILGGSDVYAPVLDKNGGFNNPIASYISLPPVLNSYPQIDQRGQRSSGAAKTIFLDFMGGYLEQGFRYQSAGSETGGTADSILNSGASVNLGNRYVPSFDLDGKLGFSAAEQAVMKEIWQRVAEDFAPFDVNVTTNWEGSLTDRNMLRIIIGGSSVPPAEDMADRYGLSLFDSMKQGGPNLAFVFSDSIKGLGGSFATLAANVASREAGHAFGLRYRPLDYPFPVAHIMGTSIGHELSRWATGTVPVVGGPSSWAEQDDLKTLTGALGLRRDDHGDDGGFTNLGNLDATGTLQGNGIIGINLELRAVEPPNYLPTPGSGSYLSPKPHDQDVFTFQTQGGSFYLDMQGVGAGQNLKVQFEVWSSSGEQFGQYVETGDLNGALKLENLPAGTYYVVVNGDFGGFGRGYSYGDLGQYDFSIYPYSSALESLFSSTWGKSISLSSVSSGDTVQWTDIHDLGLWPDQALAESEPDQAVAEEQQPVAEDETLHDQTLAEDPIQQDQAGVETEPAQDEQAQTVAEEQQPVAEDETLQDQPLVEDQTQQDLAVMETEPAQDEQAQAVAEEQQPVAQDETLHDQTLAEDPIQQDQAGVETEPSQDEPAQTVAEEQQPVAEDETLQDQPLVEDPIQQDQAVVETEPSQDEPAQAVAEEQQPVAEDETLQDQPLVEDQIQQDLAVMETEPAQDEQAQAVAEEQQRVAEDPIQQNLAVVGAEPVQDDQGPTASEEQPPMAEDETLQDLPLAEDPTQQDPGAGAAYSSDDLQQEPDAPTDVDSSDSVQEELAETA